MRKVPFVRKPDELAFATSHLAQSSSASRVTRRTSRILLPVGQACPCIGLTQPATVIFWTADLFVTASARIVLVMIQGALWSWQVLTRRWVAPRRVGALYASIGLVPPK